MNIKKAKMIAFGSTESASLEEFFDAWQWLYDNNVELKPADELYLTNLSVTATLYPGRAILTEPIDPRHQVIIDLVRSLTESGHKKEATELREKAAAIETLSSLTLSTATVSRCRGLSTHEQNSRTLTATNLQSVCKKPGRIT